MVLVVVLLMLLLLLQCLVMLIAAAAAGASLCHSTLAASLARWVGGSARHDLGGRVLDVLVVQCGRASR